MSQTIHKFDNGYGASVIKNALSYGAEAGLYELAVIKFTIDDWVLDYNTGITDDVIGHLTHHEVDNILVKIEAL